MPNSTYIPLIANRDATLHDVKEDLWELAAKYPLHGMLHDMSVYVFQFINSLAALEEVEDENKRLRDLKPVCGVLRLIERRGDKAGDKVLNTQISHLIGKGLNEFDSLKSSEVNDFRLKMRLLGEERALARQRASWFERLRHRYPPRLANSSTLPPTLAARLRNDHFVLVTKLENTETSFTLNVSYKITSIQLLRKILSKKAHALNTRGESAVDFVLKVCGQEEYLVGDYPIVQFLYIQETLSRDGVPTVVTLSIDSVPIERENFYQMPMECKQNRPSYQTSTLRKKGKTISSWSIDEMFSCTVLAICRLNIDTTRTVEVGIQAGIFHGGKSLCEGQKTSESQVTKEGEANWGETLVFPIKVHNIPRMARLCFVIYEITKTAKGLKSRKVKESNKELYINPLAWVNTTIFDYKEQLKSGAFTLYMWTYAEDMQNDDLLHDLLHPLGTVVSNPHTERCAALTISFESSRGNQSVVYPSDDVVRTYAEENDCEVTSMGRLTLDTATAEHLAQLKSMAEKDPIYEMHEQDRKDIWALREYFRTTAPGLLPKLLQCVEWGERGDVAGAVALLCQWPMLRAEQALELLDYAYADSTVRSFAVRCLEEISDEDLSLYLLQLVQALKHESYLMCDLVKFLLKRALNNMNIGHYLFWHLRSEMQVASVSIRFGLILEAYCRGCQEHLPVLTRQADCLEKLKGTSEMVRQKRDIIKARSFLTEYLAESHCQEALSHVASPLNPRFKCKRIKERMCRVMDSKMRPLWLVFENADAYGSDISIILKNGDDLRQDMLTLQMLRIMDKLWKNEGYDFRMNPYGCISMEYRVGMIEVVLKAETIANIQKDNSKFSATSPFKKGALLGWLREHNTTEDALNKAIEEFTLSCAGYCVATYVLGVADRHSDNIMVKKTGQLFHIDFGHILGHFKEKFGFRRERVPFVLTHDFVNVINKGQKDAKKEALEFQIFQRHCETAFMILRKHGHLFISLFAMMISTGLPELSSEKDLAYLRETLVLDLCEQDALSHFRSKFDEALSNSWKTSLNWASHNMAKNNKQ